MRYHCVIILVNENNFYVSSSLWVSFESCHLFWNDVGHSYLPPPRDTASEELWLSKDQFIGTLISSLFQKHCLESVGIILWNALGRNTRIAYQSLIPWRSFWRDVKLISLSACSNRSGRETLHTRRYTNIPIHCITFRTTKRVLCFVKKNETQPVLMLDMSLRSI